MLALLNAPYKFFMQIQKAISKNIPKVYISLHESTGFTVLGSEIQNKSLRLQAEQTSGTHEVTYCSTTGGFGFFC